MNTRFQRTALWAAMVALSLQGNGFAQGMVEGSSPPILPATDATGSDLVAPMEARFSTEQIEQLVAPIALYPDALLAQVLMAAGYPLEVVQAARWVGDKSSLQGQALDDAIARETWDPSIKTLVFFPTVLQRMNDNLDWTQDLGDAFLGQEREVMDAVQRLRKQAYDAGSLASNDKQTVSTYGDTIVVEPADAGTVYVPAYNPSRVYGSGWAPTTTYYPTVYNDAYYPAYPSQSTYDSSSTWLAFGAGALVGALLTSAILWDRDDDDYHVHHHHIYHRGPRYWDHDWDGPRRWESGWHSYRPKHVDYNTYYVDRSRTVNVQNNYYGRPWEHNPRHREGVSYRDVETTKRYLKVDEQTAIARTRPTRVKALSAPDLRGSDFTERRDRIRNGEGLDRRGEGADALRSRDRQGVEGLRDELSRERLQRQEALQRPQGADDSALGRAQRLDREANRQRAEELQRRDLKGREETEQGKALGIERERSRADEALRRDSRSGEQLEQGALGQQRDRSRADESLRRDLRPNGQGEEHQRVPRQQQEREQIEQRSRQQTEEQQRALRQQQEREPTELRSRQQSEEQQRALRQQNELRSRQQTDEQQRALRQQQERQQAEQQQRALRQQQEREPTELRSRQQTEEQQRALRQQNELRSRQQSDEQQRALRQQNELRSRQQTEEQQRALRQQQERQQAEQQQRALRQQNEQRSRQQSEQQQRALRQQQERSQADQRARQQAEAQQRAYQQQQQQQKQQQQQQKQRSSSSRNQDRDDGSERSGGFRGFGGQ